MAVSKILQVSSRSPTLRVACAHTTDFNDLLTLSISSGLRLYEWTLDTRASMVKLLMWFNGFRKRGWSGAFDEAAGLA